MADIKDNQFDNFDIDLGDVLINSIDIDPDKPAWDRLIEEIVNGNVIPVIGSDILCDGVNLHEALVAILAKKFGVRSNPSSFSELINDHDYLKAVRNREDFIYPYLNAVLTQKIFPPSELLRDILNIRQFPFVITTSFTPVVEQCMREVWGKELRVGNFNNDPSKFDDISDVVDMRKPTIYYMFGRVGEGAHKFALTDSDMLDFCSSWLSEGGKRPKNLVEALKGKYLLMLGNTYSDWLFRFIWYSIRVLDRSSGGLYSCADGKADDSLTSFLERNHTFIRNNPRDVVNQIKSRLAAKLAKDEKTKFNGVENNTDIFISYSRRDAVIADALYNELTSRGKRVWYDRNDISNGGNFRSEIRRGIQTTRYFVPLLSSNIQAEKNESHVYRLEWEDALDMSRTMGRTFVIPISEDGFDFYNAAIPERLQQHNAIIYKPSDDMATVAEQIIHTMNQE